MINNTNYKIGKEINIWKDGIAQTLTFIVTEDCNLRCNYCYITHKSSNKKMSFDVAKKFIDYVLSEEMIRPKGVILDFIGGEPLLEIKLIDQICDYFKLKTYLLNDEWFWDYRINVTTNGINYASKDVQDFIKKNQGKLEIAITLDGTREKHDMHRIFPNGKGSYDEIIKNIELYKNQFQASTKVTFASKDLKYLKDSIIHLWELGISDVAANVVFEDVWQDGDEKIFEDQLIELADYILENRLFDKYSCTLFDESIGLPNSEEILETTSCGAGKMIAVGPGGSLYPCMRYKDYSLNNKKEITIGDVENGIDFDKIRPYYLINTKLQSDDECLNCGIASGCTSCFGHNYDSANSNTNFQKAKYICKMHKARVRANNYYFAEIYNRYGIKREVNNEGRDKLYFLLSNSPVRTCASSENRGGTTIMSIETIIQGLEYARNNFLRPVFIHNKNGLSFDIKKINLKGHNILHICSVKNQIDIRRITDNYILVLEADKDEKNIQNMDFEKNIILNISFRDISNMNRIVTSIFEKTDRINLNILDFDKQFDLILYEKQLKKISEYIYQKFVSEGVIKELNMITDELFMREKELCDSGLNSFTLSSNGKFYICPEFYFNSPLDDIGNLKDGIKEKYNSHLYSEEYSPLCNKCSICHCNSCSFENYINTNEVNIPPKNSCVKSSIEYRVSYELQKKLSKLMDFDRYIKPLNYLDPFVDVLEKNPVNGILNKKYLEDN
ncbi:radical SAM peptide maturase, CXXX-repeat target family [Peptoniphilus sp. HMSC062D09]|uniref:radical SAM peptide maturase, CXXX-repeat target family n=1 Tax=Peptoniphilus sp. HMSC062D09 TaxID=1739305 RepID=UPI0008A53285|nr:radical SAM peptide maturase, CXXX-repeat target family [Peptoniphilus sp. HMSC062D09]OFK81139.1 radical SAM protein [Peptoniphilus sp. HMSC062D09]